MKISLAAGENDSKIVYKLSIIEVKQLKLSGLIVIGTNWLAVASIICSQ